ncbi:unnamed protein product, partial [Symbiodinium sp. CCMP2456]
PDQSESSERALSCAFFLDCRPLGKGFAVLEAAGGVLSREDLRRGAGLPEIPGWRLVVSGGRRCRRGFEVRCGETLVLTVVPLPPGVASFSLDVLSESESSAWGSAEEDVGDQGEVGHLPAPFHRIGEDPPQTEGPIAPPDDAESDEESSSVWHPTFLVFALNTVPEEVQLTLHAPCGLDTARSAIGEAMSAGRSRYYPYLLFADPQPTQYWGAAVSLPQWAKNEPAVLLNLLDFDDRCFLVTLANPFTKNHVLRAAGLPPGANVDVFPSREHIPMGPDRECSLVVGGTVSVMRPGARFIVQGFSIWTMLVSPHCWDPNPRIPAPPGGHRALVVQDSAFGYMSTDADDMHLRDAVLREHGIPPRQAHFAMGVPTPTDIQYLGLYCERLCAFAVANATTAQLDASPCVTILDCRPLLQGWALWLTDGPRVSYAELVDWLDTFAPEGWIPQVEGAEINNSTGMLEVHDGCVLVAEYAPSSSADFLSSSSDRPNARIPEAAEESDSEGPSDHSDGSQAMAQGANASRSRSPRRGFSRSSGRSTGECRHLSYLRLLTGLLGGRWHYDAALGPQRGAPLFATPPELSSEEEDEVFLRLGCAVLKVGYRPECLSVAFRIPAAEDDLAFTIQASRSHSYRRLFSNIAPILPQPIPGTAIFIATPSWSSDLHAVCFSTASLDGRVFVTHAPDYVSRHELLWLAHLDGTLEVDIYVGTDNDPLVGEHPVHLFPAALVTFVARGSVPPPRRTLWEFLLSPDGWSPDPQLPEVQAGDAYCVVQPGASFLHFSPQEPTQYRAAIARATGFDLRTLRIQAAQPIVGLNMCLSGYLCRLLRPKPSALLPKPGMPKPMESGRIIEVHPQPRTGQAYAIALPMWWYDGAAVLIDSRFPHGHIFSIVLPRVIRRDGLLAMLGLDPSSVARIFIRDMPWPLQDGDQVDLSEGDLITVLDSVEPFDQLSPLASLLRRPRSWEAFPELSGAQYNVSWILSDGPVAAAQVDRDLFASSSSGAAASLQLTDGLFTLVPTAPDIYDHAWHGVLSHGVLIACQTQDFTPYGPHDRVPFVLDLRPILLPLGWSYAEDGLLDVAAICGRLVHRCPRGFHIRLYGGRFIDGGNHFRRVDVGEVLSVEFQPDYLHGVRIQEPASAAQAVIADPSESEPDGGGDPASSSTSSRADAGTGATQRWARPCLRTTPFSSAAAILMCTWGWGLYAYVSHEGVLSEHSFACTNGEAEAVGCGLRPQACAALLSGIPTPARSNTVPTVLCEGNQPGPSADSVAVDDESASAEDPTDVLSTLLEESVANMAGYPFYWAASRLETLVEDRVSRCAIWESSALGGPGEDAPPSPRPLSLEALLPLPGLVLPPVEPAVGLVDFAGMGVPRGPLFLEGVPLGFTAEQASLFLQPDVRFGTLSDLAQILSPDERHRLARIMPAPSAHSAIHCFADGSFTPAGGGVPCLLGWAVAFLDPATCGLSIVSGGAPPWYDRCKVQPSAFVSERFALTAAVWIGSTAFGAREVRYFSDCQAALVALRKGSLSFCHVPGHCGYFGNEVVDFAAKLAAKGNAVGGLVWREWAGAEPRDWWCDGGKLIEWCGVCLRGALGDASFPSLGPLRRVPRDNLGLTPAELVAPFRPVSAAAAFDVPADDSNTCALGLCFATYNVLSLSGKAFADGLNAGIAFAAGRPALLASCLERTGVHAAAIQEARTEQGFIKTSGFLRFSSGGDAGCLGVELWFRDGFSLMRRDGDGSCVGAAFCKEAFQVLHKDSRRLILHFHRGPLRLCFASLHAPHRGTERDQLSQWWSDTLDILKRAATRAPLVIGGDFNASVGSLCCDRVGDHASEEQDDASAFLRELAEACAVWLPSTWSACHTGESWTYIQKRNHLHTRADFVCLPDAWYHAGVKSWTAPGVHVGQPYVDHVAAVARVHARVRCGSGTRPPRLAGIDARALADPQYRDKVVSIVAGAPEIPWAVSADAHAAALVGYLQGSLADTFPRCTGKPRHAYITATTWGMHATVAALRKQCAALRTRVRRHWLAASFSTWACADPDILRRAAKSPWILRAMRVGDQKGAELRFASSQLKQACKDDRAAYLTALADDVQANKPDAYQALNRLLGLRQRRPYTPDVLPEILDSEGKPCSTADEATARWRSHFGAMEAGVEGTPELLASVVAEREGLVWPRPADITMLPSPGDVCCAMSTLKNRKASGPDGIPGEFFRALPSSVVQLVMPLILKLGLLGEEAVGLKSALMTYLYKHKGARNKCESYRAIMLLPTLTKVIHKAFRPGLYEHVMACAPPILLGGRRGASVVFGSHTVRSFCNWCSQNRMPACVLFADVASAYYQSVRDLTARRQGTQADSTRMPVLPVDSPGYEGLLERLAGRSAFARGDAPAWLESLAAEMHRGSWFSLRGDHVPVITRRGSRPGSALADLMYSAGIESIVAMRDSLRAATPRAGPAPLIQWDLRRDLSALAPPCGTVRLSDVVWADDLASCIVLASAHQAAAQTAVEASVLDEAFAVHGYTLSYGVSKTAAMVILQGDGARSARRALFRGKGELAVLREDAGPVSLPLVAAYKHLGVLISANRSFLPELRARSSSAWSAFRQGRLKAYRCRRIAVARRGALLSTMVLPRLLFGAGAWPRLRKGEEGFYHRSVFALFRQTLCVPHGEDQHISGAMACALLHLPDPATLLRVERLRYLRQLVQSAPDALWALLRHDSAYLGELREAMRWLYARLHETIGLADPLESWEPWAEVMCRAPGRFRGWIKRASALESCRLAAYASLHACRRFFAAYSDALPTPAGGIHYEEACLPCRLGFVDRVSWACHASRLHGYRTRATTLTAGTTQAWCSGCGRLYANNARMRRHVFMTPTCQQKWGSFSLDGPAPSAGIHPLAPPLQLPGVGANAGGFEPDFAAEGTRLCFQPSWISMMLPRPMCGR